MIFAAHTQNNRWGGGIPAHTNQWNRHARMNSNTHLTMAAISHLMSIDHLVSKDRFIIPSRNGLRAPRPVNWSGFLCDDALLRRRSLSCARHLRSTTEEQMAGGEFSSPLPRSALWALVVSRRPFFYRPAALMAFLGHQTLCVLQSIYLCYAHYCFSGGGHVA